MTVQKPGTLDFSGVPGFSVTNLLLVQSSNPLDCLNRGPEFIQGFVIIDPIPGIFGNVAHKQINTLSIGPGAVQQGFKRMAATMRGSRYVQTGT